MTEAAGLYVHVPFCSSICSYCDFYRVGAKGGVPEGYEGLLLREAALYGRGEPIVVDTIYFGGGTPSLLEGERLGRLIRELGGVFEISEDAEITLEANPEDATREAVAAWREAGVTRLSIGVQSFDGPILRRLRRRASPEVALGALETAGGAGFPHLSVDLMIGVPGQEAALFRADLETLARFPVDHVSVYGLDLHVGSRLHNDVTKGRESLPDDEETSGLYEAAHAFLTERGFEHYEISNFALPGGKSRHNIKYWRCKPTIGIGPSAWSRFGGVLAGNHRSLDLWKQDVEVGALPRDSVEEVGPEMLARDRVIFGLRLADGIEWPGAVDALGLDRRRAGERVKRLAASGRAVFHNGVLSLTPSGFLVSNEAILYLLDND